VIARTDNGRLVAALTRRFGAAHLELIEDAVQGALARALERWPAGGVPDRPDAWLVRVAYNLVLDALRQGSQLTELPPEYEAAADEVQLGVVDDALALIFLCCHPSLPRAAQLALTLQVACGFSAQQIGRAFLTADTTIAQRTVRAKQRLRQVGARFELPSEEELPGRLGPILDVLYLMFGEGYSPTHGEMPINGELCREALRLARLLTGQPVTATPTAHALHALVCLLAARANARRADDGSLLLLAEQDRERWDEALVNEGFRALTRARQGDELSRYHLEAGIAACHAAARSYQATDWPRILLLYDALRQCSPSPVVDVNRAVAVSMVRGAAAGLDELDSIPERELMESYPFALATYAELHASLGHLGEARMYLERALGQRPSVQQRRLLERKLGALQR
jgi:predicted RNA polymerase sigma factor